DQGFGSCHRDAEGRIATSEGSAIRRLNRDDRRARRGIDRQDRAAAGGEPDGVGDGDGVGAAVVHLHIVQGEGGVGFTGQVDVVLYPLITQWRRSGGGDGIDDIGAGEDG